jgi:hypothetical protein
MFPGCRIFQDSSKVGTRFGGWSQHVLDISDWFGVPNLDAKPSMFDKYFCELKPPEMVSRW